MSEEETAESLTVEFTMRKSDGTAGELRTIGLGLQPLILIEPEEFTNDAGEEDVKFLVDVTDLDLEELGELLQIIQMVIEQHLSERTEQPT